MVSAPYVFCAIKLIGIVCGIELFEQTTKGSR